MFDLKPLSPSAIPGALAKAERYRLLNEPDQAASICEDVLAADASNHDARITFILALSDCLGEKEARVMPRLQSLLAGLESEYERCYYRGLVAERQGRAILARGGPGSVANSGNWLREAMTWYERADALRPPDNDDVRLRWNACVRIFRDRPQLLIHDEERAMPAMLE